MLEKKSFVKLHEFGQWLCKKNICWPNLGCVVRGAVCRNRIHSEAGTGSSCSAMTQHYPTTSTTAAVWARERHLSLFLLGFSSLPQFSKRSQMR